MRRRWCRRSTLQRRAARICSSRPKWLASLTAIARALRRLWLQSRRTSFWRKCGRRSEEHTSELQSLMRISYAVFCLKKKKKKNNKMHTTNKKTDKYTTQRHTKTHKIEQNKQSTVNN